MDKHRISSQAKPPGLQRSPTESIHCWSWNGGQATCVSGRNPVPSQHRMTLGGYDLKPNCTARTWSSCQAFLYMIPPHQLWSVVVASFRSHQRTLMWLSCQFSAISRRFYKTSPRVHHHQVTKESIKWHWVCKRRNPRSMPTHIVHGWLSYCTDFPGSNWEFDAGHWNRRYHGSSRSLYPWNSKQDHLWKGLLCNVTSTHYGHASLFTIHLEALARWLINEEKNLLMHACLQYPSIPRCPVRK